MPCPHPPIARRGWLVRCPPVCRPVAAPPEGSFCVRPLVPRGRGKKGGREGKSLILSPRVESSQRLRFIPKKRKEGERKEKGLQRKRELPEGGLRKPPKCRQRAMRKRHGNRRGRFPKQLGRTATGKRAGKNLGGVCRIRCNHFVHFREISVKIALLSRPLVTCSTFELF